MNRRGTESEKNLRVSASLRLTPSMSRQRIVVMGFMGACPIAGVVWQHLHYLVGLQRLGHEVYYIEDSRTLPYNPATFEQSEDFTYAAERLRLLAKQFGFTDRWAFCPRYLPELRSVGLSLEKIRELYREADLILNICGAQELHEDLEDCAQLIYVESDPGVEQIKIDRQDSATRGYLGKHRALFTFGESVGTPDFPVPANGLDWLPTRQPVVTDLWHTAAPPPAGAVFTSVANWNTSGKKDIAWRGETYLWSKSLEFLKFAAAPEQSGETFELATDIPDPEIVAQLTAQNWRLTSPHQLSVDHDLYRRYFQHSKGEFTVAKDQYVRLRTGWFSDRSACYLAAGRPVITQQTGFTKFYGGEAGLLAFETLDDIREAVAAIKADYPRHSHAASEIAREYFEATKVLADLLARA